MNSSSSIGAFATRLRHPLGRSHSGHTRWRDIVDRRRAHLAHRQRQLGAQNLQHALDALLAERRQAPDVRPSNADATRAQSTQESARSPLPWKRRIAPRAESLAVERDRAASTRKPKRAWPSGAAKSTRTALWPCTAGTTGGRNTNRSWNVQRVAIATTKNPARRSAMRPSPRNARFESMNL